jgi:hypothetical protein
VANVVLHPLPPCPARLGCEWSPHRWKHRPHRDLKPEDTLNDNAKYLPGTNIRLLETATVQAPAMILSQTPTMSEYVRPMDVVIGYDCGKDAAISFVECSGGVLDGRSFHGRPMAPSDYKLRGTPYARP